MIRVNGALFGLLLTGFAIGYFELLSGGGCFCQCIENLQIQNRPCPRAKRNRALNFGQVQRDYVGQRLLHLSNRAEQRLFETGTAVLLEGLFGHDQSKEFTFGNLQGWERLNLLGVVVPQALTIKLKGQFQSIAHELQIAMD